MPGPASKTKHPYGSWRSGTRRHHHSVTFLAARQACQSLYVRARVLHKLRIATLENADLDAEAVLPRAALRMISAHIATRLLVRYVRELVAEQSVIRQQRIRLRATRRMFVTETVARGIVRVQPTVIISIDVLVFSIVRHLNDIGDARIRHPVCGELHCLYTTMHVLVMACWFPRARLEVARALLTERGASFATVCRSHVHRAHAMREAGATRLVTRTPRTPVVDGAIRGAR